jgi:hypothetical protein
MWRVRKYFRVVGDRDGSVESPPALHCRSGQALTVLSFEWRPLTLQNDSTGERRGKAAGPPNAGGFAVCSAAQMLRRQGSSRSYRQAGSVAHFCLAAVNRTMPSSAGRLRHATSPMSITRKSRTGDRLPSCSRRTRRGGVRPTSPSCRNCSGAARAT